MRSRKKKIMVQIQLKCCVVLMLFGNDLVCILVIQMTGLVYIIWSMRLLIMQLMKLWPAIVILRR